jgi:Zn-dependent protease
MFQNLTPIEIVLLFVSIIIGMSFHEAMHAFTGHWLGDPTAKEQGRLSLNPLKHIDILTTVLLPVVLIAFGLPPIFAAKPVPFNPDRVRFDEFGAALLAVAGPLTNLVLAVVGALVLKVVGSGDVNIIDALEIFISVNVSMFVFNLIPFPPLDGSRVLYAFAPEPVQKVMYRIEQMGFSAIMLFLLILWFVPGISNAIISITHSIYLHLLAL